MNGTPWEEEIILCVDWEQVGREAEGIRSGGFRNLIQREIPRIYESDPIEYS